MWANKTWRNLRIQAQNAENWGKTKRRTDNNHIKHKLTNEWENSFLVKLSSLGLAPLILCVCVCVCSRSARYVFQRTYFICHNFANSINIVLGTWWRAGEFGWWELQFFFCLLKHGCICLYVCWHVWMHACVRACVYDCLVRTFALTMTPFCFAILCAYRGGCLFPSYSNSYNYLLDCVMLCCMLIPPPPPAPQPLHKTC